MALIHVHPPRANASAGRASRHVGRLMGAVGGFVLVAALVATGAPATAAPGDAHLAGLEYVALGDSYAAGFGLTPLTGLPFPDCAQSSENYPHQVAAELGLTLNDRTCSGATTANLTTTSQPVTGGLAPVQDASLSPTTKVVTVTIGGNDLGFVNIMTFCAALSATGKVLGDPLDPFSLDNCKEHFVQVAPVGDTLAAAISSTVTPSLSATLTDIAAKAPNAKIFVVGYPALTPSPADTPTGTDGCFTTALGSPFPVNSYPYTTTDVRYLHSIEALFDQALTTVAAAHNATMISLLDASSAHSPCATTDAYVNGITVTDVNLSTPASVTLAPGAIHPNAAGAAFQATQVEAAIRAAFPAPVIPDNPTTPVNSPAVPAGSTLAATGSGTGGWLALTGILLLLGGSMVLGMGRAAARRTL